MDVHTGQLVNAKIQMAPAVSRINMKGFPKYLSGFFFPTLQIFLFEKEASGLIFIQVQRCIRVLHSCTASSI